MEDERVISVQTLEPMKKASPFSYRYVAVYVNKLLAFDKCYIRVKRIETNLGMDYLKEVKLIYLLPSN